MASPVPPMPSKDAFARLLDGLQTFIREHLALAKAEAKAELTAMIRDLAVSAAGVPLLFAGYLMLMAALGFLLASWLPQWAAFGIVALVNLGAGGLLTFVWGRKAAAEKVDLSDTAEELEKSRHWIAQLKTATDPVPALPPAPPAAAPSAARANAGVALSPGPAPRPAPPAIGTAPRPSQAPSPLGPTPTPRR